MPAQHFFSTPIWTFNNPDAYSTNYNLLELAGEFGGGFTYFDSKETAINNLETWIKGCIQEAVDELGWHCDNIKLKGRQHPIRPGENDTPHHHPTCYLVAVYYVHVPKNSGSIMFLDPRGSIIWKDPDARTDVKHCSSRPFHKITPTSGTLIIFPGYLVHTVETNCSDDVRISVAIDITLDGQFSIS